MTSKKRESATLRHQAGQRRAAINKGRFPQVLLGLIVTLTLSAGLLGQEPLRFAVIGDSGTGGKGQRAVAARMVEVHDEQPFGFVLMLGDNTYEFGNPKSFPKKFDQPYQVLLQRGVRFYAALGNHDVYFGRWKAAIQYPGFNMGGQRYFRIEDTPSNLAIFSLDTTLLEKGRGNKEAAAQASWLESELARTQAQWKIAFMHHPLYSPGKRHGGNERVRERIETILVEGGVQVVFAGHEHFYSRLHAQNGIQYFISGNAGKLRRGNIKTQSTLTACNNDQTLGFMHLEVIGNEMRFETRREDGTIVDSGAIQLEADGSTSISASCTEQGS